MNSRQVVLLNRSMMQIPFTQLTQVAQALQIQVDRDFGPAWGISAQVTALAADEALPSRAWPILIVDTPAGGLGIHLDKGTKPFAQVRATPDWSVTASHELLEMLVDPFGHRFVSAPDIDPGSDKHRVMYLMEVGDPCEVFTYTIGTTEVSDFIIPAYYDIVSSGTADVDFLGRLSGAFDVPLGCYISWIDPADRSWHQKRTNGSFARANFEANLMENPRDDRDRALPESDTDDRHDLSRIRSQTRANQLSINNITSLGIAVAISQSSQNATTPTV